MAPFQPLQVDVDIQDCVFGDGDDAHLIEVNQEAIAPATAPITVAQWEEWFHCWLDELQPDYSPIHAYELSLRLTTDGEVQDLNAQYRHQNRPTDVLAFAALEVDYPQFDEIQYSLPVYLGDIVISVEMAQRQADERGHSLQIELAWLAAHGLLHLLGWDHPNDELLQRMLRQQETLLKIVGLRL
jgi:probable rRNA maturation factor